CLIRASHQPLPFPCRSQNSPGIGSIKSPNFPTKIPKIPKKSPKNSQKIPQILGNFPGLPSDLGFPTLSVPQIPIFPWKKPQILREFCSFSREFRSHGHRGLQRPILHHRNLLFLEGERLRAPGQRRPAPRGDPALLPGNPDPGIHGIPPARPWGFAPGAGIPLGRGGRGSTEPPQPPLVPTLACQLHQGGDVVGRGVAGPAAVAGGPGGAPRGLPPARALPGALPGAALARRHPPAQRQAQVRRVRHGVHRAQRAHGAQAQPHRRTTLPVPAVRRLLHAEGEPAAPHQAALGGETLQVPLLLLRLPAPRRPQRAPAHPFRFLPHGGQTLQVQLVWPQLQTAEQPGGAQGALPRLPAEGEPRADRSGPRWKQEGSGSRGDTHGERKSGSWTWCPRRCCTLSAPPLSSGWQGASPRGNDPRRRNLWVRSRCAFALSELPFDVSPGFDKDVEVVPSRGHALEPPYAGPLSLLGAGDPLRPLRLATNCITEVTPVISSVYTQIQALPARLELPRGRDSSEDGAEGIPVIFRSRASAGDTGGSPSNGCQDSTDTESIQEERAGGGSSRHSPAYAKEEPKEEPDGAARCFPKESLRVLNEEGEQLRAFCCEHCRVLFLDHVMFTIHMGCHGFRDPFECNICGYRSQDRYEFSSHIVRGEHKI
uniref:Uncharacterized protein n=1 Tax=Geospiza parvula TaxID=87175 RepID=A0A8C3NQV0_GEOPR